MRIVIRVFYDYFHYAFKICNDFANQDTSL
jgi:hypothetical protein